MDKYIDEIKNAKTRPDLQDINYRAFCDNSITGKQHDFLTALCVWKENQQKGETQEQLDHCAKVLKISKKHISKIK